MYRFFLFFLLTLTLLISVHSSTVKPSDGESPLADVVLTTHQAKHSPVFVWWEAEKPSATNFPPLDENPVPAGNATEAAALSAANWIGASVEPGKNLFLEYSVTVPSDGDYFFYSRKFWKHGPFRWHWDTQPWQDVGSNVYLMDDAPLRENIVANWISLGRVNLTAGSHTLRIELTPKEGVAAFDCFVLTQSPLRARGKLKPDMEYTADLPGWFLFDPDADPFESSPIDLRSLNESVAGENGFIQVNGESFVQPKTLKPVRFWAVNTGIESIYMDQSSLQFMARFLAKKGVNMVRLHGSIWEENIHKFDPADLKRVFTFINALKQEGIYTTLSIYFPLWFEFKPTTGFPGYTGQHPFSLLFFNHEFQQLYYGWWRTLLTTPNPETGKMLRDDPAVAMVELVNEDSTLFWTFTPYGTIPEPQMAILEKQFGDWLQTKYGSLDNARKIWKANDPDGVCKDNIRGDNPADGRMGFIPLSEIVSGRNSRRSQDTAVFLAQTQQQFFRQATSFLRQDLHYKGLIYGSNWITADAQTLGPLDKYSNTSGDFLDRHGYFNSPHEGKAASYALSDGDTYQDQSALLFKSTEKGQENDFNLPIMDVRYNGLPSTNTEINWPMPNRWRADLPLLASAYGSLQGSDGFFFFSASKHSWDPNLSKFSIASPVVMGQFPATAWLYRKGLLDEGSNVVDVALTPDDLNMLRGAPVTAPQNLDELRKKDIAPGQAEQREQIGGIDPLAFLVGKVNLRFVTKPEPSRQADLSQSIDREHKTIRSSTGQLFWNYAQGLVTVNAPKAQGVTGFLKQAGTLDLADVVLTSEMDYGTILLVALDDQPLAQSRRMVLQVASEEQNLGWKTSGESPRKIESVGHAPIAVRNLAGSVSLKRSDANALHVTALDWNGYSAAAIGNATSIQLQPNTLYYVIEK